MEREALDTKKVKLVLVAAGMLAFLGCAPASATEPVTPNGPSAGEIFERKVRCASYLESEIKKLNDGIGNPATIREIFYSPSLNTCIFAFNYLSSDGPFYLLRDVLTGGDVFGVGLQEDPRAREKWLSEIERLKAEGNRTRITLDGRGKKTVKFEDLPK